MQVLSRIGVLPEKPRGRAAEHSHFHNFAWDRCRGLNGIDELLCFDVTQQQVSFRLDHINGFEPFQPLLISMTVNDKPLCGQRTFESVQHTTTPYYDSANPGATADRPGIADHHNLEQSNRQGITLVRFWKECSVRRPLLWSVRSKENHSSLITAGQGSVRLRKPRRLRPLWKLAGSAAENLILESTNLLGSFPPSLGQSLPEF